MAGAVTVLVYTCLLLWATLVASDRERSFVSSPRGSGTSLLRLVPPSAERGPPPGSQFVPIPVVPLPSGAMRHPHAHLPPPSLLHTTTRPSVHELFEVTETLPPPPPRRPSTPRPVPFWATTTPSTTASVDLIHSEDFRTADGNYTFEFEAKNSVAQHELGYTRHEDGQDILVKLGYYRFVSPEGLRFRVDYLADEYGYRAYGDHLPK
ncbi:endocuticle structural glycoprotein SgAbd-1-like [Periplaneta americana]|uniref:endocuticle structural glycoprotein SgAbd-1-like n=1 Tax=Periplaneta americana TaxID=6978 RepID=UPI0037E963C5